jgi:precorrin-2/cobalt-factor-2 C20-methyltransferase
LHSTISGLQERVANGSRFLRRIGAEHVVTAKGHLIGIGVGPGDPELMTLKAVRALAAADVVAHFAKSGRDSNARRIAAGHIRPDAIELPLLYPVTTETPKDDPSYVQAIETFFDDAATRLAGHLDLDRTVAVLSEGDPLFYGSYMHIHVRLSRRYPTEVVAGVTSLSGCWSAAGMPIAQGDDILTILPATLPHETLADRLAMRDAAVVIKLGRNLAKVRRALSDAGRLPLAIYVERGTMAEARVLPLADKTDDDAPYFAVVLVPGFEGRR